MSLNGADDELGRWSADVEGVLHANPWFSILQQAVRRPDGSAGTHYTIHHARPAVGIVVGFLTGEGTAILLISSELPEIIGMSDRVAVMSEGRMTATVSGDQISPEKIMSFATGTVS